MRMILTAWLLVVATYAGAQPVEELKRPGVVALMRHALAPGTGDPAAFELDDCSTQRNLDERGRAQARRTGEALRAAGIAFDAVWTSQWCRTRETARLLDMGTPEAKPPLNSFFAGRGSRARQTQATRALIAALPPDARVLIVTHQVNITALTGRGVRSGEIVVTRRTDDGLEVVESYLIAP
jgi:broad specificity phosphatase PhoE